MRPIWAICTKSGQKCSRIGQKKFNHGLNGCQEQGLLNSSLAVDLNRRVREGELAFEACLKAYWRPPPPAPAPSPPPPQPSPRLFLPPLHLLVTTGWKPIILFRASAAGELESKGGDVRGSAESSQTAASGHVQACAGGS